MTVSERFLRYVAFDTQSDEFSETCPSTDRQKLLGAAIVEEMLAMGITDAHMDEHGYVYGTVPGDPSLPTIGLIAHMDTSPDASGADIKPRIVEYAGGDILLNTQENIVMKAESFESLANCIGKHLIVTDGTTLLGADDKAGIAEIMTLCERILTENLPHGELCIAFTPDEEIGEGPDHFDVPAFGAKYAYTVDGGAAGSIEYENFNAAGAVVEITGVSVHPGSSKNIMENAILIAQEFNALLPADAIPARTEGYEGFFHLDALKGTTAFAEMDYIIRDHDKVKFEEKKALMESVCAKVQASHPTAVVKLHMKDSYYNMKEQLADCMHLVDNAKKAAELAGVTPTVEPIRGGTDGARLSYMGLPCPNLGTGGYNFHGPLECIAAEDMDKVVDILGHIVALYSK